MCLFVYEISWYTRESFWVYIECEYKGKVFRYIFRGALMLFEKKCVPGSSECVCGSMRNLLLSELRVVYV